MDCEKITKYLNSLLDRGIPSVDCMIYENHKILYRHMNGKTDAAKVVDVSADTDYLMYSMSKVQTMVAIMQLVEKGKVSLDDEVAKYLPAYKKLKVKTANNTVVPLATPMLIKHLVSMQSGLDYDLKRPGILKVLDEVGQKATTRQIVDSFALTPLEFVPGETFLYSLSHDVVAAIVEVVADMSFGEYMKKNIWEPMGMGRTRFAKPDNRNVKSLAQQYIIDAKGKTVPIEQTCEYQLSERYESGGAGLISCTEDFAKFGDVLASGGITADGKVILNKETIEIMKTNLLGESGLKVLNYEMKKIGYGYGCGVMVFRDPEFAKSKAPKGIFGWDGAAGSCLIMDTVTKRSLVYIQHVKNCDMSYSEIHPKLRDMLFE